MTSKNDINSLPTCPVETTLMLIGSKWKVLILRDLIDGKKKIRRAEKINRLGIAEGADGSAS